MQKNPLLYRYEYNPRYLNDIEVYDLKEYNTILNEKNALEIFDNVINDYTLERFARFCNNNRIQMDAYFTIDPLKMIFLQGLLPNVEKGYKAFKAYVNGYINIVYPQDTYFKMLTIYREVYELHEDTGEVFSELEREVLTALGILDIDNQYSYLLS